MNVQAKAAPESGQYFKILADGTKVPASDPRTDHVAVLDTQRQLEIYIHSVGIDGQAAPGTVLKKYDTVGKVDALGGGWRLATLEEAESIIDRDRFAPACDPNLFPHFKHAWHLTSKPAAWAPSRAAWWVLFSYGVSGSNNLNDFGWALAVRPAGQ